MSTSNEEEPTIDARIDNLEEIPENARGFYEEMVREAKKIFQKVYGEIYGTEPE